MVSIYDIAKETGVTATTVSRVLNHKCASTQTRVKVLQAVEKLGYIPNARASSLKSKTINSIAVIVPDIANPIYPVAVKAIHDVAKERGYYLILGNTYGRADEERVTLEMMARERVAGLIMGTSEAEAEDDDSCFTFLKDMINTGVHLVFSGRETRGLPIDVITVDNVKGTHKATSYLLRIGRKRVAFLAGASGLYATENRFLGYKQALSEKGLQLDGELLSFDEWSRASGQKQMQELLNKAKPPDAVVCGNDLLAIGAMEAIENAGLAVPDDVAIAGFDNIELASLVRPRLTTVHQPQERIGGLACNLLLDRIEGKETGEPKEILIEPELVIRESA
ncbi:MAG: LacI family transcriptional regulator [Armatimonadetes bacterium]|nr:LacI family transcriptional regulator [Armatimonadota bacterium]